MEAVMMRLQPPRNGRRHHRQQSALHSPSHSRRREPCAEGHGAGRTRVLALALVVFAEFVTPVAALSNPMQCDCCALDPSMLKFTTTTGAGNCGMLQDASGNKLEDLACSGLYFGGKGVAVPLPASVPDMDTAFTQITACNAATGELTLSGSSAAETGSILTCTSGGGHCAISTCETTTGVCTSPAGVCTAGTCTAGLKGALCTADSDCDIPCLHDTDCGVCDVGNVGAHCRGDAACGCLFGAPLPVPNPTVPAASTCVINGVAQRPSGTGACAGDANVTLPLHPEVFLAGGGDPL